MSKVSPASQLAHSQDIATKIGIVFRKRLELAQAELARRLAAAHDASGPAKAPAAPVDPIRLWSDAYAYAVDASQRTVLFWDTVRQRGNAFIAHVQAGLPPVLHFDYEMVVDGRALPSAVNYALVRITPPAGVIVDPDKRPYIIIDPRAGHGPGIGGFKDDSQVGVALRAGHPVYFVIFFRDPEPGQTLLDVCRAEQTFVRKVRDLHPKSPKPAILGNCQGGWAAMMVAASDPDDTGPIVINGAPMSYWSGAWQEGAGDNPIRYAGGMLGGTWLASLSADMGDGVFDGAHLVENFENLNPANTFWDKYYHLYANVDTESPRFLEFERWWGGFYLMNREEIEWITRNLFVGNRLWKGETRGIDGGSLDLRAIKAPIVLFASMGDNITPPQQAFNWVADVYGSTDEIKARGQVIVGLVHENVGHLGIFVSGKVAKKEHTQIVSVLESIEALPPGLYGMRINERPDRRGKVEYEVEFEERTLEDVAAQLNRFQRQDEKPFEALAAVSEFNQRAYELFLQPLVQAGANEYTAKLGRTLHPLRMQRWAFSDMNPWLQWIGPAANMVRAQRAAASTDNVYTRLETAASAAISASLDHYRAVRDAASEAAFILAYGNVFSLYLADRRGTVPRAAVEARELPFVQDALAAIRSGGYAEALARVASLLARQGEPLLLARLAAKRQLLDDYRELLPDLPPDQWRRIRGEQDIIVRYEPDEALATLPELLRDADDRTRFATLVRRLVTDQRMRQAQPTRDQLAMVEEIERTLVPRGLPPAARVSETSALVRAATRGAAPPRKRTARPRA